MVAEVRLAGRFNDNDEDFTAARIRQEVTNTLQQVFGPTIVDARSGAWVKKSSTDVVSGQKRYRLPHRAMAHKLVTLSDEARIRYEVGGDVVEYEVAPNTGETVDFAYYLRPSLLTDIQTAGLITAVDKTALTVTFAALPVNRVTSASIATGDAIDIVRPNGWHELALVGAIGTLSGAGPYVITFPAGTDMTDVAVGDYVRSAEQTDWPCLEKSFHPCLAVVTAARMHRSKGNEQKARALEAQAVGTEQVPGDLRRFAALIEPRMQDETETCVPEGGPLRGRRRPQFAGRFQGF